ncbi:MAG: putative cyclase [Naasia sp.]|nr:putative cyclase [Naasia sp.]
MTSTPQTGGVGTDPLGESARGRWGEEDERGALNLLTPEITVTAAHAVRNGRIYRLDIPIQHDETPAWEYRGAAHRLTLSTSSDPDLFENPAWGAPPGTGANEDMLFLASHNGTHIDALSHVFHDNTMYNGFPADTFRPHSGAGRNGVQRFGPVATRGVVLDIPRALGFEALPADYVISYEDLEAAEARQNTKVQVADAVLIRTGWMEKFFESARAGAPSLYPQPGIGLSAARFLAERDVALVGSDNSAVEGLPSDGGFLASHIALELKRGIPFMENLTLEEVCEAGVSTGLFIISPLSITGASASPIAPFLVT